MMRFYALAEPRASTPAKDLIRTEGEEWVDMIRQGDRQVFGSLIKAYQRLVALIVFRMVPNSQGRRSLCQEVFIKVYEHIGSFRGEAKISTWIGRIAYHTCLNHLKKMRLPLFGDISAENRSLENVGGEEPSPAAVMEKEDQASRLQAEMDRLAPQQRTLLTLFHVAGASYEEIGRIMNLPVGTVKSMLFRARQKLPSGLRTAGGKEES